MEEKKFVCRFCSRKFPCGKSLGGHIRTHMMSENEEKRMMNAPSNGGAATVFKFDVARKRKRSELGSSSVGGSGGDDGNYIYGLRENPKKTTRFVHSNAAAAVAATVQVERFCKNCGKSFTSLKAMCGHMASHPKSLLKGVSGVCLSQKHKLVIDSQSDTEDSVPTDTRKLKRMKLKILSNDNRPSSSSPPLGNCSSSISEVDQSPDEVARTLMKMSRDKGRFALVKESSDNTSAVVEAKSKSPTKVAAMDHGKSNVGTEKKVVKVRNLKYYEEEGYDSHNSDSGYFLYGPKKVESDDASSEWCLGNRFQNHDYESSKKIQSNKGYERDSFSDDSVYESDENSTDSDSYAAPKTQTNKNNMNGTKSGNKKSSCKGKKKMKSKKNKEHDCPLCERSFKSGQALGGHKRSHFVGGYDESTFVIRPGGSAAQAPPPAPAPAPANPGVIDFDLNLPAPDDE
ncbi:unnamed protein product [Lathyrus sativus]|nr:unnamed protein product [Lathyrus sativus]